MPVFVTGMSIIILFHIHFLSNLFYCSIQYVRRSVPVASSYLLTYSPHVKLILLWYDGEDMIVLGTSGCGDDLVCNVVIISWAGGLFPCLPWLRCPICGDLSTALDLCLHFCCFDVHSVALSCSFWTSDVSLATSKSNLSRFLAHFGLLTCPSPPRSPPPTILLYLDALSSLLRKRKKQCQYFTTSIALYLTYLT